MAKILFLMDDTTHIDKTELLNKKYNTNGISDFLNKDVKGWNVNGETPEEYYQVNKVYDKLESLGITKEDVKGILGKLVDLVKEFLN